MPQPGDVVSLYLPPRVWGGGPAPVFDIGLFYGPGARLFLPVGWQPVALRRASRTLLRSPFSCARIRQTGACTLLFERDH